MPARTATFWIPPNHLYSAVQINVSPKGTGFHTPSPPLPLRQTLFSMTYQEGALRFVSACLAAIPHPFCFQLPDRPGRALSSGDTPAFPLCGASLRSRGGLQRSVPCVIWPPLGNQHHQAHHLVPRQSPRRVQLISL